MTFSSEAPFPFRQPRKLACLMTLVSLGFVQGCGERPETVSYEPPKLPVEQSVALGELDCTGHVDIPTMTASVGSRFGFTGLLRPGPDVADEPTLLMSIKVLDKRTGKHQHSGAALARRTDDGLFSFSKTVRGPSRPGEFDVIVRVGGNDGQVCASGTLLVKR